MEITGLILAGGKGRRMGHQDKGLVELHGQCLVQHVIQRLKPQVREVVVNANRNLEHYRSIVSAAVIADRDYLNQGPLSGIYAAMAFRPQGWLMVVPCDCPLLPHDLVSRMKQAAQAHEVGVWVAHDGTREQPLFMLVDAGLKQKLAQYLQKGGFKVDTWYRSQGYRTVDFSDQAEAFINVNTPEQLKDVAQQPNASAERSVAKSLKKPQNAND